MRLLTLALLLLLPAACYEISSSDGVIQCSNDATRRCGDGWYCAQNGLCYRNGHDPVSVCRQTCPPSFPCDATGRCSVFNPSLDLTPPPDLSAGARDLTPAADLVSID